MRPCRSHLVAALTAFVLASLPALTAHADGLSEEAKLERLRHHLDVIHDEAETRRYIGGGVPLVMGIGLTALGLYFRSVDVDGLDSTSEGVLTVVFLVAGVSFIGAGGLVLAIKSDYESRPEDFERLVRADSRQTGDLVRAGEATLEGLARDGESDRTWSAIIFGVLALASAGPVFSGDTSALIGSLPTVLLMGGLAGYHLLFESTPEEAWSAYQREVGGGAASAGDPGDSGPRWVVSPMLRPSGAGLGVGLTF